MIRLNWVLAFMMVKTIAECQSSDISTAPRKGSYLYFGQPAFEDNSFLLEEAMTQEKGIMQYTSNFYFDKLRGENFLYSFNHEIPLGSDRHQISYLLTYYLTNYGETGNKGGGLGDLNVSYHYMVTGKKAWAMVVPGATVIIPTAKNGFGSGGLGGQLSLLVTKRLSHRLVTHYNFGYTYISSADLYISNITGSQELSYERDLQYKNLGASVVWYQSRKFNWFTEYILNFFKDIKTDGSVSSRTQQTLNPGFRFAIDHNRTQIVPGISTPIIFSNGKYDHVGLFFHLSFEMEYLPFTKPKSR